MYRVVAQPSGMRRGVAATEMALLLPFLVFTFCVAVDFCRAYHTSQVIDSAARSAALYGSGAASRDPNSGSMEDAAKQAAVTEGATLSPPLQASDVTVNTGTDTVDVTVTYQFEMLTSNTVAPNAITITRTVTMPLVPRTPGAR